jgi:hypothetical protein
MRTSVSKDANKLMSGGQRAYEARRAAKAGMTLEKWLSIKDKQQREELRARAQPSVAAKPAKPPGFWSRLLDRAHKPL